MTKSHGKGIFSLSGIENASFIKVLSFVAVKGKCREISSLFCVKIGGPDIIMIICSTHQPFWSSCRLCAGKFTGYI